MGLGGVWVLQLLANFFETFVLLEELFHGAPVQALSPCPLNDYIIPSLLLSMKKRKRGLR